MKKKKNMNNHGFELDSMIAFLVCFGVAILVVVVMAIVNKFV